MCFWKPLIASHGSLKEEQVLTQLFRGEYNWNSSQLHNLYSSAAFEVRNLRGGQVLIFQKIINILVIPFGESGV